MIPDAGAWADRLGNLRKVGAREWSGPCPLCGGDDRFHVKDGHSGVLASCRKCAATFGQLYRAVWSAEDRKSGDGRIPPAPKSRGSGHPAASNFPGSARTGRNPADKGPSSTADYARKLWASASSIPAEDSHPARRWIARRHLWRPGYPLPVGLAWLDEAYLPHKARGSGRRKSGTLVAALAPVSDWLTAWPAAPRPASVQCIFVHADGRPVLDAKGRGMKRIYGPGYKAAGRVLAVLSLYCIEGGCPAEARRVRIAEGIADCPAIGARYASTALAVMTASAMQAPHADLVDLCAESDGVTVHADRKGDKGPGRSAAFALADRMDGLAVNPPEGAEDAADAAGPFGAVDSAEARDYARTLQELYPTAPTWEVARQVSIAVTNTAEGPPDDAGPQGSLPGMTAGPH